MKAAGRGAHALFARAGVACHVLRACLSHQSMLLPFRTRTEKAQLLLHTVCTHARLQTIIQRRPAIAI